MTTGYPIDRSSNGYFLTFTVVDWVDVFTKKIYKDIVIDSFKYCRNNKGLKIWAYIIMTNHIHCILSARQNNLSDILRDFKRHTASTILKANQGSQESRRDWIMKGLNLQRAAMSETVRINSGCTITTLKSSSLRNLPRKN